MTTRAVRQFGGDLAAALSLLALAACQSTHAAVPGAPAPAPRPRMAKVVTTAERRVTSPYSSASVSSMNTRGVGASGSLFPWPVHHR